MPPRVAEGGEFSESSHVRDSDIDAQALGQFRQTEIFSGWFDTFCERLL